MNILYELWLHDICGHEPNKIYKCIKNFGSAEEIFNSKGTDIKKIFALGIKKSLRLSHSFDNAERILEDCKDADIHILTIDDKEYPEDLKKIYMPPRILYVKGEHINLNDYLCISIIGIRTPTIQGREYTENLSNDLASCGCLIVSGMADGIDSAAHKGALKNGSKTIAVLAGGVDIIYPASNRELYFNILKNGAIISERPPGAKGLPRFYQQRNRIIAGLSKGIVVAEGKIKGGSSITAKYATECSRDLFAVPGNPIYPQSELPNSLIDDGAKLVNSAEDILAEFINIYPELLSNGLAKGTIKKDNLPKDLTEEEYKIVQAIRQKDGVAYIDELEEITNFDIGTLTSTLMLLVMKGILLQDSGNKYVLLGG